MALALEKVFTETTDFVGGYRDLATKEKVIAISMRIEAMSIAFFNRTDCSYHDIMHSTIDSARSNVFIPIVNASQFDLQTQKSQYLEHKLG